MATYLLDFDGVFFRYGTMEPVKGAVEFVQGLQQQGHNIVFLTRRRRCHNEPPHRTVEKTEQVLATLGVTYDGIIEGVTSPLNFFDLTLGASTFFNPTSRINFCTPFIV